MLVTREGLPVGYEVFPGATFEGHSLISVLKELQARYDVRKMIFVADRGMLNEDNLSALDEAGAYYIVGAKLKQLPAALQTIPFAIMPLLKPTMAKTSPTSSSHKD